MTTHRTTATYSEAFRAFLDHTDEKAVLLGALTKRLQALGTSTLLDIGAGNGALSVPLAKAVKRYVALEQKDDYAKRLQEAGLEVIHAPFPCEIAETFDAVLLSHSLPPHSDGREGWEPFVSAAWRQVNDRGHLLIVTFEDEDGEWNDLVESSGLGARPREKRLGPLKEYLQLFGVVAQDTITTHVRTDNLDDMMRALAFVWSDGKAEHMEAFLANRAVGEHLGAKYRTATGYEFPFHHYLVDVHR